MIVSTMTKDEVLREIRRDYVWVLERTDGIRIKYNKVIKSVKANRTLGIVNYTTPNRNKVTVVWRVIVYGKGLIDIACSMYFHNMTPKGLQFLMPLNSCTELLVYTSHCIDRMQERGSMSFGDYIRYVEETENKCGITRYKYDGKETQLMSVGSNGAFIVVHGDWGITAVTFIGNDQFGENQSKVASDLLSEVHGYVEQVRKDVYDNFMNMNRKDRRNYSFAS